MFADFGGCSAQKKKKNVLMTENAFISPEPEEFSKGNQWREIHYYKMRETRGFEGGEGGLCDEFQV